MKVKVLVDGIYNNGYGRSGDYKTGDILDTHQWYATELNKSGLVEFIDAPKLELVKEPAKVTVIPVIAPPVLVVNESDEDDEEEETHVYDVGNVEEKATEYLNKRRKQQRE